jgi:DNA-binding CsgD family transcriptional regulator/predicted negative regulator of RcsB-dependent stress response
MPAAATPGERAFRSSAPLRGRDEELERIGERLSAARSGIGSVVTVAGDPGLGKTRLLEEAARIARRAGVRFTYAAADPSESVVPLSSLMTAMFDGGDPLLDRSALKELRAQRERYWLIQELGMLLEEAATSAPLCVCLDDLQWADGATVAALRVLPTRLAPMPIVWVGALRPGQTSPELRAALAELDERGADRIELQSLDDVAVTQIVMDIVGADPTPDLLEVTESAKGVPFFLQELVLGLLEEGLIRVENGEARLVEARLPARVRESMLQRLGRLSDSARRTALVASVLGRDFGFEDLALMREVSPGGLLDPVEELTRAAILIETSTGLEFRHDITRQAVQDSLPVSARRALERQAVAVLLSGGALPVAVAAQLAGSAEPGDESAANTLRQAAHGLGSSDPGVAADLSQKALDLTPDDGPARAALIAETALLLHAAGRAEEGRACVDSALRSTFTAEDEAEVRLSIAGMLALSPDVRAEANRLALALPGVPLRLRAQHVSRRVHNLLAAGRDDEVRTVLSEAVTVVDSAGDTNASFALELAKGAIAYNAGEFESALSQIRAAGRLGKSTDEVARRFLADEWTAEVLLALDRMEEALQLSNHLLRAAERGHQAWEVRTIESFQARRSLMVGRLADTSAILEDRFGVEGAHSMGLQDAAALVALGRAALHTGNERETRRATHVASRLLSYEVPGVRRHALWLLALVAMASGDAPAARAHICGMGEVERLSLLPLSPVDVTDEVRLARIALAAGDGELAVAARASADGRASLNPGVASIVGTAAHVRGLIDDDLAELDAAIKHFQRGPRPIALASALEDRGAALLARGDRDGAVASFGRALELYAETRASRDETRVRGRLRQLGVRRRLVSPKRPDTGWEGLTQAELTVVRLVAEGMTNREVARQLYVSPHTINAHLRHAFSKLDINSRVELARLAIEHGAVTSQN